jgi:hypothetical protein
METGVVTIPYSMKQPFFDLLAQNTVPWEKRPFIPAGVGKFICKMEGDEFSLQEDGHSAPRPIVKCRARQEGEQCAISWSESPQMWFKIYFVIWCSVLWLMILSGYFSSAENVTYKAPFLEWLAGGAVITVFGCGAVWFNDYLAHSRARKLGDFLRRIAAEVAGQAQTP